VYIFRLTNLAQPHANIEVVSIRRTLIITASIVALGWMTVGAVAVVQATQPALRLPPKSAPVQQVLRVYLRAAKAHNCRLTQALTTGQNEQDAWGCDRAWSLYDDHPELIAYKNIGAMYHVPAAGDGSVAEECIPVDIREADMDGAPPGALPGWEFCFARTPGGWRLIDGGYG
jgi:hypothetical protein